MVNSSWTKRGPYKQAPLYIQSQAHPLLPAPVLLLLLPLSLPVQLGEPVQRVGEGDAAPLEEVSGQGLGHSHRSVLRASAVGENVFELLFFSSGQKWS